MLIFGHGTLCVIDGLDAGIRSGGNYLFFFLRLNLVAWFRFVMLVLKEACIRCGLKGALDEHIEAYKRINEALQVYLARLEEIDKEQFKKETAEYNKLIQQLNTVSSEEELTSQLLLAFKNQNIELPWQGDFHVHMSNPNGTLIFK
jgi:hypothetical protein